MLKTQIAGACFVAALAASPTFAQKVPDFTTPQGPPALSDVPADSAGSTRETWEQMTREWEARQRMQGWRESDAPRTSMAPSGAVPR